MQKYSDGNQEEIWSYVSYFFLFCFAFAVQLLGIPTQVLQQGLTHRKIEAKTEEVTWLLFV